MQCDSIHLEGINEVWAAIQTTPSILRELSECLTFQAHNYRFSPAYKKGHWDGKIRLIKAGKVSRIYKGLTEYIRAFCQEREYSFSCNYDTQTEFEKSSTFVKNLRLTNGEGKPIELYDHQKKALDIVLKQKRATILSPTASGKSIILYIASRYYLENIEGNILILVPNISLVNQLYANFQEYSQNNEFDVESNVCRIYSGQERDFSKRIWISTWQSMYDQPAEYFDETQMVIYDEVHGAKAKKITALLEKIRYAEYRYGFTGTLDNVECHELTTIGLFGPISQVATTNELVDNNHISKFSIKCIHFQYSNDFKRKTKKLEWRDEVDTLIGLEPRNRKISEIAVGLSGNVLILFSRIEHGQNLEERIRSKTNRPVYFIYGATPGDVREDVRAAVKQSTDSIIIASSQIFSAGIDINTLEYLIFAHPFNKSRVRILQSIGRILRKCHNKKEAVILDLVDDLRVPGWNNYSYRHFDERVKLYLSEDFSFENHSFPIKTEREFIEFN